jgi:hypothetical protein
MTTLPPSGADCLRSGSLNILEPSGSVPACNGIALHLYLFMIVSSICCHRRTSYKAYVSFTYTRIFYVSAVFPYWSHLPPFLAKHSLYPSDFCHTLELFSFFVSYKTMDQSTPLLPRTKSAICLYVINKSDKPLVTRKYFLCAFY